MLSVCYSRMVFYFVFNIVLVAFVPRGIATPVLYTVQHMDVIIDQVDFFFMEAFFFILVSY